MKKKRLSQKHKKRISETRIKKHLAQGKNNPMYGKKHKKSSKIKMSINSKGRKVSIKIKKKIKDSLEKFYKHRRKQKIKTNDNYIKIYMRTA